eukprot:TRINITY_DN7622_c0_g1_i1.p1 TRINITY_DN7622_c0_g1~~TRINITY_DN7622_c0_g1_i1.p1  ORF type:complete len:582 (-),score=94.53 TRINITY_DN7622_c0_g1_i1:121-1866(-)
MTTADEEKLDKGSVAAPAWKDVAKNLASAPKTEPRVPKEVTESFKSDKGLSVIVVDSSAFIDGGERIARSADKLVTVPEVLKEMKDSVTRRRMCFLPSDIQAIEPSDEALQKVLSFARATGDLHSLSSVDLKVLALTYTLEVQAHGTAHLRTRPPPLHVLNVRRLPEPDLPGWGSNVPNLEEWEALDNYSKSKPIALVDRNKTSRILGVKTLDASELIPENCPGNGGSTEKDVSLTEKNPGSLDRNKKSKNTTNLIVVAGIDASNGVSNESTEDWMPVVRKSSSKKHNRKQNGLLSRLENVSVSETSNTKRTELNNYQFVVDDDSLDHDSMEDVSKELLTLDIQENETQDADVVDEISVGSAKNANENDNDSSDLEGDDKHLSNIISGDGSEQSFEIQAFSKSSVACATHDFAMQNVILQMGLRLLTPTGRQVHQLNRWVLKCHACNAVTSDVNKIFCPKCGNGGTLSKVSVTVGENGVLQVARRRRITTRGTRYSLPLPKGGREAITKNPVLREDQVAPKILYSRKKKKATQDINLINLADFSFNAKEKSLPFKPPIRETLAVFRGKRNPNDNHYSQRRK